MLSDPKVEYRNQRHYVAIRTTVDMKEIPKVLPPLIPEVFAWLGEHKVRADGPPFFRYLSINQGNQLVAEVGVPVQGAAEGDDRFIAGIFPAGQYVTATHMGHYDHLPEAHMAVESWITKNRSELNLAVSGNSSGSRTEFYPTDPENESDPDKWQTDIEVLLKKD